MPQEGGLPASNEQSDEYGHHPNLDDLPVARRRGIGADDGPKIRRAFQDLHRQAVYTRFFIYNSDVTDADRGCGSW